MEKNIIATGKTIDLAIESALTQLGLDRDSVSVQVIQQAKQGFLGFGSQLAKVQVTYEAPDPAPEACSELRFPEQAQGRRSRKEGRGSQARSREEGSPQGRKEGSSQGCRAQARGSQE